MKRLDRPLDAFLKDNLGPHPACYQCEEVSITFSKEGPRATNGFSRVTVPLNLPTIEIAVAADQLLGFAALSSSLDEYAYFKTLDLEPDAIVQLSNGVEVVVPEPEFLGVWCFDASGYSGLLLLDPKRVYLLGKPLSRAELICRDT